MNKPIGPKELDLQAILASSATSRRGPRRVLGWTAAGLAAGAVLVGLWWYGSAEPAPRYMTEAATRGRLTVLVTATGSVQPTNKVEVSSELSGTVRRVLVDFNSVVAAGQVLAELDTDKLKATVESSRARLAAGKAGVAEAEATLIETELDLARKKLLASTLAASKQSAEQAQAARDRAVAGVASARANVGIAEAELHLNETNLRKASITSPISGVVLTRKVDPGQTVASTLQAPVLFTIAEDLKQMELQVDVDEADVGKVKVGQTASFAVDAFPERRFPATIRDIRYASETIQGVVTYKAVLEIDNSEMLLRPGMTATAEIKVTEIDDALLVPNTALRYAPSARQAQPQGNLLERLMPGPPRRYQRPSPQEETGRNRTVWVLDAGQPSQVRIEIGASDGKRTQVRGGALQPGTLLIVDQNSNRRS
jgi:HlyD family secretion protein